jgi:hypothetical protein
MLEEVNSYRRNPTTPMRTMTIIDYKGYRVEPL